MDFCEYLCWDQINHIKSGVHVARWPHELIINSIEIDMSLLFPKVLYNHDGNPQTIQLWLHYLTQRSWKLIFRHVFSLIRERGIGWQKRQGRNHKSMLTKHSNENVGEQSNRTYLAFIHNKSLMYIRKFRFPDEVPKHNPYLWFSEYCFQLIDT